jgi:hypothetical protein
MSTRPPLSLPPSRHETRPAERLSDEEAAVIRAIRGTAFGAIEVVLHQARIVQVVRSEKTRFDAT